MKRLIDEKYETYNDLAHYVEEEFRGLIGDFIKNKIMDENISSIDLEYVLSNIIQMECVFQRAYKSCASKRKERNNG